MTQHRPKLERTGIGKEHQPRLEPHILREDPNLSYHAPHGMSENDRFYNHLIVGDNLLAVKALKGKHDES